MTRVTHTRPTKGEGPTVAAVALQASKQNSESLDFRCTGAADQAALTIEGEEYARAYLDRLQAGMAQPDELAVLMAFLADEMLHGACRILVKALRGCHG
jgi:hypothetical protein